MPIKDCKKDGKNGYKYGDHGSCYTFKNGDERGKREAKRKAIRQGVAIRMSQERRKKNKS